MEDGTKQRQTLQRSLFGNSVGRQSMQNCKEISRFIKYITAEKTSSSDGVYFFIYLHFPQCYKDHYLKADVAFANGVNSNEGTLSN